MTAKLGFTASQARANFAEIFDAAFHDGPVIIRKNSKSVAVVNVELLKRIAALEDAADGAKATEALKDWQAKGGTSLADVKRELGID